MAKVLIGNVRGPQGPKGDPGEIGPQGPQGPQGPVGPAVTETDPTVPEWAKQETPPVKPGEDLTDSTVSYTKSVPADSIPYAEIVEIGGMMQKCNQLWDEEWVLGYYDNSQGGALVSYTTRFACKNKIRVQPNTKYYISATDTIDICFYNSNEEFIDNSGYDSSRRFTTPSDCAFITFNLWITYGTSYKNDIMLNEGSTALPYEPYVDGLRSTPVTEVESVDADDNILVSIVIPAEVQALDGYGAGNPDNPDEYNAIRWEDGGWKYYHVGDIVDGAWVTLSTPVIDDISHLFTTVNLLPVEAGGTVTLVNEYGYDVPSTIAFYGGANEIVSSKRFVGDLKGTAARAEADAKGNSIHDTYETKEDAASKAILASDDIIDDAAVRSKSVPEDTVPYSEVVEIGGKTRKCTNLIAFSDRKLSINGVVVEIKDSIVRMTGTSAVSGGRMNWLTDSFLLPAGSYCFNMTGNLNYLDAFISASDDTILAYHYNGNFTLTEPTLCHLCLNVIGGYEFDFTGYFMLTPADAISPFEPYFDGLRSAAVTEVESMGVNLFDVTKATIYSRIRTNDGTLEMLPSSSDQASSDFIFVFPNTKYVLNFSYYSTGDYGMAFYDSNKGYISGTKQSSIETSDLNTPFVFTTPNNCYYIRFSVGGGKSYNDVSLNKGSTAQPYTPYVKHTLPLPEVVRNLDGYGWGIDETCYNYIDLEKKQYVQRVGCVDLGTLDWSLSTTYKKFISNVINNIKIPYDLYTIPDNLIADKYTVVTPSKTNTQSRDMVVSISLSNEILIRNNSYTDAATFKAAMSGVMLVYELATPIITDITDLMPDNLIGVEGGGTVTMVNEYGYDVPNTLRFRTGNNEVIGADVFVGDLHGTAKRAEVSLDVPEWAKKPNMPTPAEIGAAPAGFGLGGASKDISGVDLNTVTANGWYQFANAGANCPVGGYSYMFVASRNEDHVTQTVYASNNTKLAGITMKRARLNGEWYPWEYENPYMELGAEYRTTERFLGKPVYTKLFDCGLSADSKAITHGITGGIIRYNAVYENANKIVPMPSFESNEFLGVRQIYAYVGGSSIVIRCGTDRIEKHVYCQLWYTKD